MLGVRGFLRGIGGLYREYIYTYKVVRLKGSRVRDFEFRVQGLGLRVVEG